jgi:2-keto-4-pentenoate hydratase/2-oxohepta-3-ene-1,7-dioic acid hydratase in catechol pathway
MDIFIDSGQRLPKAVDSTMQLLDEWDTALPVLAGTVAALVAGGAMAQSAVALKSLHILAPVRPKQVFCIGANYKSHMAQLLEKQPAPALVICTGSPAGNGAHYQRFLRPGDVLEGEIDRLGSLRNVCVAEAR